MKIAEITAEPCRKGAPLGTIVIADDHEVFRYGLAQVLRRSLNLARVLEAATFDEAIQHLAEESVIAAIVDLGMPGLERIEDLARVRRRRADIRLVVLSGSEARESILAALAAGAHGYIVKNASTSALLDHIKTILGGTIYVPECLAQLPPEASLPEAPVETPKLSPVMAGLTDRQRDVLKLIAEGFSNKRIAHALAISEGTVKMHVTSILRVTGASNRAQAAALGKQFTS
jgi:DNA-binding NarL/FixJ family response regulator